MAENHGIKTVPQSWQLRVAAEADVEPTIEQLTDHMNDQQRQALRDKLQRYVQKPDRDLILALRGPQILGLICVIDQGRFPPGFSGNHTEYLRNFACGTQVLVHPTCRRRGIGGSLLTEAENWAHKRRLTGFWVITHRMSHWYEKNFGYQQICQIEVKGVAKTLMAKKFD
jgi:GNAT superfamily N-acetyltransferase